MRFIDNKYRVLCLSYSEPLYDKYIVEDIQTSVELSLYMFKVKFFTDEFAAFIKNSFFKLSTINSQFLEESIDFRRVRSIDDELAPVSYYYVCKEEYVEQEFFHFAQKCSLDEKIQLFMSICVAVYSMHSNGLTYSGIPASSILVFKHGESISVKLKNIVMRKFNLYYKVDTTYKNPETDRPIIFENEKQKDIYSLALIFFSIFTLYEITSFSEKDIRDFFSSGYFDENDIYSLKLRALFTKILLQRTEHGFGANDLIAELNEIFEASVPIATDNYKQKLLAPDFVSRVQELQLILSSAFKKDSCVSSENVFVICGEEGAGKTRLLKEIETRLQVTNTLTFSFFDIGTELSELCNKFLDQTHLFTTKVKDGVKLVDLNKDTDDGMRKWAIEYLDFFEQSIKNMRSIAQHSCVAIIIDDVHKITEREFLGGLFLSAYNLRHSNFIMIIAYDKKDVECGNYITERLAQLQPNNFYKEFFLKNLTPDFTEQLISTSISFKNLPERFFELIFLQSGGNPKKMLKVLYNLFNRRKILFSEKTGFCELSQNYASELKTKKIDLQIINENLNKRISDFTDDDVDIVKLLCIFNSPIDERWLFNGKSDTENLYLKDILSRLILTNTISVRRINGYTHYVLTDYILKDLILSNLTTVEAANLHSIASKSILSVDKFSFDEELAYHLKYSNNKQAARRCYIKLAIQAKRKKNLLGIVDNLFNAVSCTKKNELLFLARLYLDIAIFKFELGDLRDTKKYLTMALRYCEKLSNKNLELEIRLQFMVYHDFLFNRDDIKALKPSIEKILLPDVTKYHKSYATYLRLEALSLYDAERFDEAFEYLKKAVALAEGRPAVLKEKSNSLRIMADIMFRKESITEVEDVLNECISIANKVSHVRGILYGYVDLAFCYSAKRLKAKAMEYYRKIKIGSIKYNIISSEVLATDYIVNEYFNMKQYTLAFQYSMYGLEIARKYKMNEGIIRLSLLLVYVAFSLNDNNLAIRHYAETKKYVTKYKLYTYDFELLSIRYYMYFHEYEKAYECLKKIEPYDVLKCGLVIGDMNFFIQLLYFETHSDKANIEKVVEIITQEENNIVLIERSYFAFLCFLRIGDIVSMRRIYDLLVNIEKAEISKAERTKIYFIRSFFERKNARALLLEILKISFQYQFRLLKIYSLFELARTYIEEKKYTVALAYYLEAADIIRLILTKFPNEQRFNYFHGKKLFIATENINAILNREYDKCIVSFDKNPTYITPIYFKNFFKTEHIKFIPNKASFFKTVAQELLSIPQKETETESLIDNLNTDIVSDINTVLLRIVTSLLATEAFILMTRNKNDVEVIAHYSYLDLPPNLQMFYKISSSKEPVFLNKTQIASLSSGIDIHSCLSFPITRNVVSEDNETEIMGYVYVASTYAINLIERSGIAMMKKCENLLGLLIRSFSLYQLATIDKLTRAVSRATMNTRLEEYSNKYPVFSVVYYDLDSFKSINDTYGHDVGDRVLSTTADVVRKQLSEPEFLGRQGGEEFVVCLPNHNSEQALKRAEEIRKVVEKTSFLGYNFKMTISLGIATYGEHSKIIMDVMQKADQAMYHSKQTGKNKVTVWNDNLKLSSINVDTFSQIAGMNNVWKPSTVSFIVEILELANSKNTYEVILQNYLEYAKSFLDAEEAFIVFSKKGKILNNDELDKKLGVIRPFWFTNVTNFLQEEPNGLKILSDFPIQEINAIFRNGVSILLIPIVCKEKFLGVTCFTIQRYIKEFSFADASIQAFTTRLIAHSCLKVYDELEKKLP